MVSLNLLIYYYILPNLLEVSVISDQGILLSLYLVFERLVPLYCMVTFSIHLHLCNYNRTSMVFS